jgi:hypothetical protein
MEYVVSISYIRDGEEMIEIAPHQYVNRKAGEALGLIAHKRDAGKESAKAKAA